MTPDAVMALADTAARAVARALYVYRHADPVLSAQIWDESGDEAPWKTPLYAEARVALAAALVPEEVTT